MSIPRIHWRTGVAENNIKQHSEIECCQEHVWAMTHVFEVRVTSTRDIKRNDAQLKSEQNINKLHIFMFMVPTCEFNLCGFKRRVTRWDCNRYPTRRKNECVRGNITCTSIIAYDPAAPMQR